MAEILEVNFDGQVVRNLGDTHFDCLPRLGEAIVLNREGSAIRVYRVVDVVYVDPPNGTLELWVKYLCDRVDARVPQSRMRSVSTMQTEVVGEIIETRRAAEAAG